MNRTGGNSNMVRNVIIFFDLVLFNIVAALYGWNNIVDDSPNVLVDDLYVILVLVNLALAVSQLFFSTIIHKHYKSFDCVIRQYAYLMSAFAVSLCLFNILAKYAFDQLVPNMLFWTILTLYLLVSLFVLRTLEYVVIKKVRLFGWDTSTIVFMGDADQIEITYENMDSLVYSGVKVLGYYSDKALENKDIKMPYLGTLNDLTMRIKGGNERFADEIYCSMCSDGLNLVPMLVDYSVRNAMQFNYIPSFSNGFGQYLKPRVLGDIVVFSNLSEPLMSFSNRFGKRAFDVVVSCIALLVFLPFLPFITIGIKVSSRGPVFFRQKRTGLDGRTFDMLKFRSMHVNSEADTLQCTKDDPRKFMFGEFLRRYNIDEFPQFINVLKGDMSIVGPRPHMLVQTDEYRLKIYEYMLRQIVRPGITGWAQVTGFRGETSELWQMEGRVKRDLWYIQNWTFWLDLMIIFRTTKSFFMHDEHAY